MIAGIVAASRILVVAGSGPDLSQYDYIYTVQMVDGYGDGWNGNYLTVSLNDAGYTFTITLDDGFNGTAYFGANHDDLVSVMVHKVGEYPEEIGFSIPELDIAYPIGSFPSFGESTLTEAVFFQAPNTVFFPIAETLEPNFFPQSPMNGRVGYTAFPWTTEVVGEYTDNVVELYGQTYTVSGIWHDNEDTFGEDMLRLMLVGTTAPSNTSPLIITVDGQDYPMTFSDDWEEDDYVWVVNYECLGVPAPFIAGESYAVSVGTG